MTESSPHSPKPRIRRLLLGAGVTAGMVVLVLAFLHGTNFLSSGSAPPPAPSTRLPAGPSTPPRVLASGKHLTVWWDALKADIRSRSTPAGDESNIHPTDYVGPAACKECHKSNYEAWTGHPHRLMNMPASAETVRGDFSGTATLSYRGGKAVFGREAGDYLMRLQRGEVRRTYRITQTIGSRFFQYYVGRQLTGPEPADHPFFHKDHVLPFGWWLDAKEWVPTVHVGSEVPDEERPDPFNPPDKGMYFAEYAASCNYCHTTFPLGDLLARRPHQMGEHAPLTMHWSVRPYLAAARPNDLEHMTAPARGGERMRSPMADWDAAHYAATFGVSCEACHLGTRAHVESKGKVAPLFFPKSPYLSVETGGKDIDFGRTHDNINWACGRCHTGTRPTFAAGMSTWNSVEYSDAMLGSCYSQLRCIDCHSPHRALGSKWSPSPDRDDAVCLKCHDKFRPAAQRLAHTHHPAGSEGARCLNCHMPRINEGLQDVVRTHMIYSPTRADMIQANHPNACNLCHTDRPIDWTLGYLKQWYGRTYDDHEIAARYPDRTRPVALGWLKSDNPAVRLVAADALTRVRDRGALLQLLDALDDPYLVNRQFTGMGVERMLKMRLADFGYRFYLGREERRQALMKLRAKQK
jgi:predicted CXXCH cytochrome family protein